MTERYITVDQLPEDFQDTLAREFIPYSVALGRVIGDDPSTFRALGSGTIVRRGGVTGILTAHHCLHGCNPKVSVGPGGTDTLALLLRGGRTVVLQPSEAVNHPLAHPGSASYGPFGPDLSFLHIEPGPRLQSVLAYGSAWNLDQAAEALLGEFGRVGNLLVSVGFPEERCKTTIQGNNVRRTAYHETLINSIAEGAVENRDGWDFVSSKCDYSGSPNLVSTFKGFSGGGIWSIQVSQKAGGPLKIEKSALVGVTFWETDRIADTCYLRGHFIKSIYDTAWQASSHANTAQ